MRQHIKSRFPAAKVNHLPDTVSYDTLFSDILVVDDSILSHVGVQYFNYSMPNIPSLYMVCP